MLPQTLLACFEKIKKVGKKIHEAILGGPVYFGDDDIDQVFHVLGVSEDGEIATMRGSNLPSTESKEYMLLEGKFSLRIGEDYHLSKKDGKWYFTPVEKNLIPCSN